MSKFQRFVSRPALGGLLAAMAVMLAACGTPEPTPAPANGVPEPTPDPSSDVDPMYFQGKTVQIVVAWPAGSSSDLQARWLADRLPQYIAGNPRITVTNLPGASGIVASNRIWNAPGDGLLIGHGPIAQPDNQLERAAEVEYEFDKFRYVWSYDVPPTQWYVHEDSPYMRLQDAIGGTEEFTLGTEFIGAEENFLATELDIPLRVVGGLQGGVSGVLLMFDRKEVHSTISQTGWVRFNEERPGWIADGYLEVFATTQHPDVPIPPIPEMPQLPDDVRNLREFLNPEQIAMWDALTVNEGPLFRTGVMSPQTPEWIRDIFSDGFVEAFNDPGFTGALFELIGREVRLFTGPELDEIARGLDLMVLDEALRRYSPDYVSPFN